REGEGHEAPGEEQRARDDLRPLDQREHVTGREERAEELGRRSAHRRLRQEVQEPVQTEDDEDEAQEDAGGVGGFRSHGEPSLLPYSMQLLKKKLLPNLKAPRRFGLHFSRRDRILERWLKTTDSARPTSSPWRSSRSPGTG